MTNAKAKPALSATIGTSVFVYRVLDMSLYQADNDRWHFAYAGDKTLLSLAGSFIAGVLDRDVHDSLTLDDFEEDEACEIRALDSVSRGRIREALAHIGVDVGALTNEQLAVVDSYEGCCENNRTLHFNWENWNEVDSTLGLLWRLAGDLRDVGL